MTNEEASVLMAEMAKVDVGLSTYTVNGKREVIMRNGKIWNPEKNIAQMLEVINVISNHYMISKIGDRYKCYIYEDGFPSICLWKEEGITFQQAIFQAVKAYLEGKS